MGHNYCRALAGDLSSAWDLDSAVHWWVGATSGFRLRPPQRRSSPLPSIHINLILINNTITNDTNTINNTKPSSPKHSIPIGAFTTTTTISITFQCLGTCICTGCS